MKHYSYGPYEKYIKRSLDCLLAVCALIVLSPILGVTALLIRIKLGSPILFYRTHAFVTVEGNGRGRSNAYIAGSGVDVGADIFRGGLCLPSDNKMTPEQQDRVIEIIHRCFG